MNLQFVFGFTVVLLAAHSGDIPLLDHGILLIAAANGALFAYCWKLSAQR